MLPLESIVILEVPPVDAAIVSALGKNIPVLESPDGLIDGADVVPADTTILVEVIIPAKLAPVLTFPTSCTLVTDILLLFSYLSLKEVKVYIHSTLIISARCTVMRY
jgi:hypothetical protein